MSRYCFQYLLLKWVTRTDLVHEYFTSDSII